MNCDSFQTVAGRRDIQIGDFSISAGFEQIFKDYIGASAANSDNTNEKGSHLASAAKQSRSNVVTDGVSNIQPRTDKDDRCRLAESA